jgi:hypothetical protein
MCLECRYLGEGGAAKRGESSLLVGREEETSSSPRDIIGVNQLRMARRRLVGRPEKISVRPLGIGSLLSVYL